MSKVGIKVKESKRTKAKHQRAKIHMITSEYNRSKRKTQCEAQEEAEWRKKWEKAYKKGRTKMDFFAWMWEEKARAPKRMPGSFENGKRR